MNSSVFKISWGLAVVWAGLLSVAILLSVSQAALASHDGPILVVDAFSESDEDLDGDYHFRTIQAALRADFLDEYSIISVNPGQYVGDVVLELEGLELRSKNGALQTSLDGQVLISARNVVIDGFDLNTEIDDVGLRITEDGTVIENSRISGARHGVLIEEAHRVLLRNNQIYDHQDDAILIRNSWIIELHGNEIRGNAWAGLTIDESHDLVILNNQFTHNLFGGIWIKNSQRAQIRGNQIDSNGIVGLSLDHTSEAKIQNNQFESNDVGLVLVRSVANELLNNRILQGRTAGLVIKNEAHGNLIRDNVIKGNQGRGAIGIRLAGNVHSNEIINNEIVENGSGLVLAENESGSPINNLFENNEIVFSDSSGISIEVMSASNRFVGNEIHHNLEEGIASSGLFTIFENNDIFDNGTIGLMLSGSRNFRVQGNAIFGNGAQGILLSNTSGALLLGNEVLDNQTDGIVVEGSRQLRLLENLVVRNGGIGMNLADVERLALIKNHIQGNRDMGVYFRSASDIVVEENGILANGNGGLLLEDVLGADIDGNHFEENMRYGLYVLNSEEISALRNYWGDPAGPAGGFAGSGDAALGLDLESLSPWLPAQPADLLLRSVTGEFVDANGAQYLEFDASDRLGMIFELHNPGLNGSIDLVSLGLILAARHNDRPEVAPELNGEMGFYSVHVDGITDGTAEISILYAAEDEAADLNPNALRLFVLTNGEWEELPGLATPELRQVSGEIAVDLLQGALIGLGVSEVNSNGVVDATEPVIEESIPTPLPGDVDSPEALGDPEESAIPAIGGSTGSAQPTPPVNQMEVVAVAVLIFLMLFGIPIAVFRMKRSAAKQPSETDEDSLIQPQPKPAHVFRVWPL